MKKKLAIVILIALSAVPRGIPASADGGRLTVHFFKSGVCPVCGRAERELPDIVRRYPRIALVHYEVRNSRNQVTETNRRNINMLVSMLQRISSRLGGKPFIYENRTPYAFALVNGVPYYIKKLSETTTVKKEVPLPVFVLGDSVYVGYQPHVLEQALARYGAAP